MEEYWGRGFSFEISFTVPSFKVNSSTFLEVTGQKIPPQKNQIAHSV